MPRQRRQPTDLAKLRDALVRQSLERNTQANRKRDTLNGQRRDADAFRDAISDVIPLAQQNRVEQVREPQAPLPHQRHLDDARVLVESMSDQFEVDSLLHADESLSWCASGIGPDVLRKLRGGVWKLQAELDLHGFRVEAARNEIGQFLRDATHRGLRCVRIVHGKGLGSKDRQPVLKINVRRWLSQRDDVLAFCQARPADGGAGALVVLLKSSTRR